MWRNISNPVIFRQDVTVIVKEETEEDIDIGDDSEEEQVGGKRIKLEEDGEIQSVSLPEQGDEGREGGKVCEQLEEGISTKVEPVEVSQTERVEDEPSVTSPAEKCEPEADICLDSDSGHNSQNLEESLYSEVDRTPLEIENGGECCEDEDQKVESPIEQTAAESSPSPVVSENRFRWGSGGSENPQILLPLSPPETESCGDSGIEEPSEEATPPLVLGVTPLQPPPMPPVLVFKDNDGPGPLPWMSQKSAELKPNEEEVTISDKPGYYRISSIKCLKRVHFLISTGSKCSDLHIAVPNFKTILSFWSELSNLFEKHWESVTSLTLEFNTQYPLHSMIHCTKRMLLRTPNLSCITIKYFPLETPETFDTENDTYFKFPPMNALKSLDLSEAFLPKILTHVIVGTYGAQLTTLKLQSSVCTREIGEILWNLEDLSIHHVIPKTLGLVGGLLAGNSKWGRHPKLTQLKITLGGNHLTNLLFPWLSPFWGLREIYLELEETGGALESFCIPPVMCHHLESLETFTIKLNEEQSTFTFLNWLPTVKILNLKNVTSANFDMEPSDEMDKQMKEILHKNGEESSQDKKQKRIWHLLPLLEEISVEWRGTKNKSVYRRPST